uniref:H15 domain-containing protein n=1 Tax=Eptatretus burgeri TaxID=7764 RepID=A0A8C4PZA1_EPTBU
MAETAPLPTALSTSASPLKRAKNKPGGGGGGGGGKKSGVTLPERIIKAVGSSKERNGLSMFALKRALEADGYDLQQNSFRVKTAVKKLVESERLVQTKGKGAAGSFKLNKEKSAKCRL